MGSLPRIPGMAIRNSRISGCFGTVPIPGFDPDHFISCGYRHVFSRHGDEESYMKEFRPLKPGMMRLNKGRGLLKLRPPGMAAPSGRRHAARHSNIL